MKAGKAKIVKMTEENLDMDALREAGRILRSGGLVAFPTETVYGLGGNALDPEASRRIYAAKGRPSDNPLIVHIADLEHLFPLIREFPEDARKLAERYWPGPLTMIFQKSDLVPYETTGGLDTVAVRFPDNAIAREMIRQGGGYVAAPSANTSGRPSPTLARHVEEDLGDRIDMIIDGGQVNIGLESTIVDFSEDHPVILRPGFLNQEMLEDVIGEVTIDPGIMSENMHTRPKAPGMRYKHYAPKANVVLLKCNDSEYIDYVNEHEGETTAALCCDEDVESLNVKCFSLGKRSDYSAQAHRLFDELRKIDEDENIKIVYSRLPSIDGVGMAVYNRLIRAAGFEVIDLEKM